MMRGFLLAVLGCLLAQGQEFEAAVVKKSAGPGSGPLVSTVEGGPGHGDPAEFRCLNATPAMLVEYAYGVKSSQISGPKALEAGHFDITAKIGAGATEPEFRKMLQNLLAERFGMKLHHESRELASIAVTVSASGLKMPKAGSREPRVVGGDVAGRAPRRSMTVENGVAHMELGGTTMAVFCGFLSNQLGIPVFDETGLEGKYDIMLDYGVNGLSGGSPLQSAVQKQLGLKLEKRKMPVDFLVVDHIEKSPVEH